MIPLAEYDHQRCHEKDLLLLPVLDWHHMQKEHMSLRRDLSDEVAGIAFS